MNSNSIHIIYYPSTLGYSAYSPELDGIRSEGKTIQELFEKIKYLLEVRIKTLKEIGREKEATELENKSIIFAED